MAVPRSQLKLQPSLLVRLTDDEPKNKSEPTARRGQSPEKLRKSVVDDLNWLFNCTNLAAVQNLDDYPEVINSVINYGVPDFSGHTLSNIDEHEIVRLLKQVIIEFEPRILRQSLKVRLERNKEEMSHNAMTFDIEGELWADPAPLHVYLKTKLDLEIGSIEVYDYSGTA